ncbi:MAG: HAMP domain-containing protein [Arenicella sp.]
MNNKKTINNSKVNTLNSIQTKVSFMLVLLTMIIFFFMSLWQIYNINERLNFELVVNNQNTATKLSNHIRLPMWQLDTGLVNESLNSEFLTPDVYAIMVKVNAKQLYTAFIRDDEWTPQPLKDLTAEEQLRDRDDLIASTKTIWHKSKVIGEVIVFSTKKFNNERVQSQYVDIVITIFAIGLVLVLVTFLVLNIMVIRRVNKLSEAALTMSQGRFFDSLDVKSKSGDEIDQLSFSMNMLNKSYQIARDELKSTSIRT